MNSFLNITRTPTLSGDTGHLIVIRFPTFKFSLSNVSSLLTGKTTRQLFLLVGGQPVLVRQQLAGLAKVAGMVSITPQFNWI